MINATPAADHPAPKPSRWRKFSFAFKAIEVRLRFVAILVVIGLLFGYWETLRNYWDKWTRPAGAEVALEADTEFYCPMDPQVIRDSLEPDGSIPNCPICGMPLSKRKKGAPAELAPGVLSRGRLRRSKLIATPRAPFLIAMSPPQAIYTAENCRAAYQLNWSLSLFATDPLPDKGEWYDPLAEATEADGVRLLECRQDTDRVLQFLISTTPDVSPSTAIRSVKGRLQYGLRDRTPHAFRRNYRLESVGEVNNRVLQAYVANQANRHRMADARVMERLAELQFHDNRVDLSSLRSSAHGQFVCNLHLALENAGHLHDVRQTALLASRDMLVRACAKKGWRLSRAGIVSNHVHVLLGCHVVDSPSYVALSLLNNLAYAQGMKPAFEFGYYAGTFGNYDRDDVRRMLL